MALALSYLLSFLLLVLLLPYSTIAQTSKNQSLGSSLTAQNKDTYWVSPSGDFAFGFQQIVKGGYLLAIWFNKIHEPTIVWSANGDNLVPIGSKVELTKDGQFVLSDPTGKEIWKPGLVGTGVAYAAMLDSGNFVLASQDSDFLWQSFDHPTDTILPTMTMQGSSKLVAHYSERNYSNGRFQFRLTGGNLVLETRFFPLEFSSTGYWSSETEGSGFLVVFNQSGSIYLTARNGSILKTISSNAGPSQDFYQRAVMEYDGKRWAVELVGSTATASYEIIRRPECLCPDGYSFIDPDDVMKGCKQNFQPQSCDEANPETDQFELIEMPNVNWPLFDYAHFQGQTEDWCRKACLDDCFCAVVIFGAGQCWKKKIPLSNGMPEQDTMLLSSLVFLNLLFLFGFRFKYWKPNVLQVNPAMPGMNLRSFTYEELRIATDGFKEELGSGAFATVYKGVLQSEDRYLVAVKRLNNRVREGDLEFNAEVSAIGRTNHRNLVQLLGFCNEGQHRLLVYEFMSNGSLASFLFGDSLPNWYQRIQIALGTARGLSYLHEECSSQIIHCDIKPQNILLDDSFTARISDFGLAKLLKLDQTRTTTGIRGTKGYVAPEWFRSMPVTVKVDVYSFGILLLELICCRKNFDAKEQEDLMVLADWAYDCFKDMKLELLVANDEEAIHDMKRVEKYVMIAIWCIQEDPSLRPTMKKVVQMMEGAVEVSVPPGPSSFISSI
uniref:Receptor-like serine/threonine-protein kinase n=1 Tax=Fagus sylvatica TaxID=28930 RepID=A0A2N9J8R2_FAGSY